MKFSRKLPGALRRRLRRQAWPRKLSARGQIRRHRHRAKGNYRRTAPQKHPKTVVHLSCPPILSFEQVPEEMAAWMMKLRATLTGCADEVVIDHRPLEFIGSAAALVLIAEMFRGNQLVQRVRCRAWLPTASCPKDLLGEIGYYDYFPGMRPSWVKPTGQQRYYLRHRRGEAVDTAAAQAIQQHLLNHRPGGREKFALYEALVEVMNNAHEWGYDRAVSGYRSWWVLGYRDEESGEISYTFYDQGRTIPTTIRDLRLRERLKRLPTLRSSKLIERAIIKGRYSRTGKGNRGNGLPALKHLIDKAGQGRMLLMSREALLRFLPGAKIADRRDLPETNRLHGTLISWLLVPSQKPQSQANHENDLFSQ
jgi:hypothetical protein